ncbi:MAG: bifunctional methylenetetrahydrofolate dehydrogenase/methenyltetrahydrofolate cyclohydrolase FolD [Rhizobiales bacterium]|nr:bifunctional methylenetetrahydrofolate dehydrogenase/methenyltetrahydrofolate cyclohydrolase FolD [Hyphomicrobiales bacterium]NRB15151.1 bifunctional methylenetetrahydrofolate dehydrogenase/methenyltetrahydrofolate cyclohydrolase FolD [Hyphomicrobiales bacterium]
MTPHIAKKIDGRAIAQKLRNNLAQSVAKIKAETGKTPTLAVVLVGQDPASEVYVRMKRKQTQEIGMTSIEHKLPADTSQQAVLDLVKTLNDDDDVNGILVQFPVPDHISQQKIIELISPEKDVDGLHPLNAGKLAAGVEALVSCTPMGCVLLAKDQLGDLTGLNAVIIGRSNLVGKPVAQLLLKQNATVTICHSRSKDIAKICANADLLIAAVGRPNMVKADWVKPGACVIDVGINRIAQAGKKDRLVGDVDAAEVSQVAGSLSPVPGGVGPMTIACLLRNTLQAFCAQNNLEMKL